MTHEEAMTLIRELGELQRDFSLCDKSEENVQRGCRIREIKEALGIWESQHNTDGRRPCRYKPR